MTPAARAEALVRALDLEEPEHLDLELIAASCGVFVRYDALADEEAHLLRRGGVGLVTMAERTRGSHKGRFILAHELAHLSCHPDLDDFVRCTGIGVRRAGASRYEVEANAFAEALLFPRSMFAPLCAAARPTLHDVSALADRFRASLSATALRYVRFAAAPCAVVCSKGGRVAWSLRSASFAAPVPRGHALGGAAYARLALAGMRPPDAMLAVDAHAWGIGGAGVDLHEHTRSIDAATALSFLWHPPR